MLGVNVSIFSPFFQDIWSDQDFKSLKRVNGTVCGRLHSFMRYHTTLKATQKFRVFRLKNEHFPHLNENELHIFGVTYVLPPIYKIQNPQLGTKQEI